MATRISVNIVPSEDQAIYPEWINYYEIPVPKLSCGYTALQKLELADPAISQSDIADYTAIVPGLIFEVEEAI